jgi:hypothetical protein
MNDDIIPRIKFIGKIQQGEKINVKHMYIQQDNLLTKISRSFINLDGRANTLNFICNTIKKGFEILFEHLESDKQFDRTLCSNLIIDLHNCKSGIINIKDTYADDIMFCCKLDALLEETEARLSDIENQYKFGPKFEVKISSEIINKKK